MTHYTLCLWPVSDLELTFSVGLQCPWTGQFTEVPLVEGGCNVTVSNEHKVFNNILYIRIYIYISHWGLAIVITLISTHHI